MEDTFLDCGDNILIRKDVIVAIRPAMDGLDMGYQSHITWLPDTQEANRRGMITYSRRPIEELRAELFGTPVPA